MQTFLPYASFTESARVLDRLRLGKQRVEAYQILKALRDPSYGWRNHPAVKMWRGYEEALARYAMAMCIEWTSRGYRDTVYRKIQDEFMPTYTDSLLLPHWLGAPDFHESHRSNLVRKLPEHYSKFFTERPDIPYVWPN